MKSALLLTLALAGVMSVSAQGTDKSKRPSPPKQEKATTSNGVTITIDYSAPSVKGRTIGKDLEPKQGEVWRTGANEATTFEIDKAAKVEGRALAAGKYSLFTIWNGATWTVIFNKEAAQWGAYKYKQSEDVLRVDVKAGKAAKFAEQLDFDISKDGTVTLQWGDQQLVFSVK